MKQNERERIGMTAFINYRGGVKGDDSLVDDRSTGEPLAVLLGGQRIPKGIEDAVYDMEVGEERYVDVPPELGYGVYIDKACQWYPRMMVDHGYDLKVGSILSWTNPETGEMSPARVIETTRDNVKIDMNHPFAGKELRYWVKLVDLQ